MQAAIAMAQVEIQYGSCEPLVELAKNILLEQSTQVQQFMDVLSATM